MGKLKYLEEYKNKKVLITGHTGFKGSWLSIWLSMLGAKVVGAALDPKTIKDNFVISGVSKLVKDYRIDIRDRKALNNLFMKEKPEIVFHLAAQPIVLESYINPFETFEINTLGTANVLEAVRLTNSVKVVVMITTDKVYYNKEWFWPYRENDRLGGYDPYSASKAAAEIIIDSYRNSFFNLNHIESHGKSIASVRAGNVIGGGDWSPDRIIPDCIRKLEKNEPIEIRNPFAIRPWQHVLEPLGGYLKLGMKMLENPLNFAEAWNFGPYENNVINVKDLVTLIINNYGEGKWIDKSKNNAPHEAKFLSLDISKAKHKLKWKPLLNINETIKMTIEWYKNYQKNNNITFEQIDNFMKIMVEKNGNF